MPDDGPSSDNLPKGKTFMWIEPNHPIQPPAPPPPKAEPPKKMPPVQNVMPKNRLTRA